MYLDWLSLGVARFHFHHFPAVVGGGGGGQSGHWIVIWTAGQVPVDARVHVVVREGEREGGGGGREIRRKPCNLGLFSRRRRK